MVRLRKKLLLQLGQVMKLKREQVQHVTDAINQISRISIVDICSNYDLAEATKIVRLSRECILKLGELQAIMGSNL